MLEPISTPREDADDADPCADDCGWPTAICGNPRDDLRSSAQHGITLLEVLIAALMGAMIAGGTMLAFTTAKKTSVRGAGIVEAADFAQQTIERFRNKIACNDPDWFTAATCATTLPAAPAWTADGLPASPGPLSMIGQGGSRQYQVTPDDCDGVDGTGDCFKVETKVSWSPRQ